MARTIAAESNLGKPGDSYAPGASLRCEIMAVF
jgi:hypothetical protein